MNAAIEPTNHISIYFYGAHLYQCPICRTVAPCAEVPGITMSGERVCESCARDFDQDEE